MSASTSAGAGATATGETVGSRRCGAGHAVLPDNGDGGFTGGGQIGYNYQIGSFVIGVETDIQWTDTDQDETVWRSFPARHCPAPSCPATFDNRCRIGSARCAPRAGVAFDRVLVYATGGLAYTDDNTGWVAGGGVEWALPVNWFGSSAVTFGLEGLWVSVDSDDDSLFTARRHLYAGWWRRRSHWLLPAEQNDEQRLLRRARQAELQVRHLLSPRHNTRKRPGATPGLFY